MQKYSDVVLVRAHRVSGKAGQELVELIRQSHDLMAYIRAVLGKTRWGWYAALCAIPRHHPTLCCIVRELNAKGNIAFGVDITPGRYMITPYRHSDAERLHWLERPTQGTTPGFCYTPVEMGTTLGDQLDSNVLDGPRGNYRVPDPM